MEDYLSQFFWGNTIQNWLISLAIILMTLFLAKIVFKLICKSLAPVIAKTKTKLDDHLLQELESPLVFAIIIIGFSIAVGRLTFTDRADFILHNILKFFIVINITWMSIRLVDVFLKEYLFRYSKHSNKKLNSQLIPLFRQGSRLILWSLGIIVALNNAGQDVAGLIAGFGIGGIAIALAAQDTVKNIFGGITIFLDKPFKISDKIKIDAFEGVVEEIGMRRTRIRTAQGRLITIPNAQFSEKPIENISREPSMQVKMQINLPNTTSPEQIRKAKEILREITQEIIAVDQTKTIIYFSGYTAANLSITFIYHILKGNDVFTTQSMVNSEMLERFRKEQIIFTVNQ
jgi:MscS family membrane protein